MKSKIDILTTTVVLIVEGLPVMRTVQTSNDGSKTNTAILRLHRSELEDLIKKGEVS